MHTNGPDQRDCPDCKKPIGNRPRITRADGKVICMQCYWLHEQWREAAAKNGK